MQEVLEINQIKKARSLLHPIRVLALEYLTEPKTCRELAEVLNITQQRLNHHLREMRKAGLIRIVKTRKNRNLLEAVYQRTSKAYWFSPELACSSKYKARKKQDVLALHQLLLMSETLHRDVVHLLESAKEEVPNLGFEAEIVLKDEDARQEFAHDILRAFHAIAEKYQTTGRGTAYKILICTYPKK